MFKIPNFYKTYLHLLDACQNEAEVPENGGWIKREALSHFYLSLSFPSASVSCPDSPG